MTAGKTKTVFSIFFFFGSLFRVAHLCRVLAVIRYEQKQGDTILVRIQNHGFALVVVCFAPKDSSNYFQHKNM
jgi:hypothetical protein